MKRDEIMSVLCSCMAEGRPEPKYVWEELITGQEFQGPNIQLNKTGEWTYVCNASNTIGQIVHYSSSDPITVNVSVPVLLMSGSAPPITFLTSPYLMPITSTGSVFTLLFLVLMLFAIIDKCQKKCCAHEAEIRGKEITDENIQQVEVNNQRDEEAAIEENDYDDIEDIQEVTTSGIILADETYEKLTLHNDNSV